MLSCRIGSSVLFLIAPYRLARTFSGRLRNVGTCCRYRPQEYNTRPLLAENPSKLFSSLRSSLALGSDANILDLDNFRLNVPLDLSNVRDTDSGVFSVKDLCNFLERWTFGFDIDCCFLRVSQTMSGAR